MGNDGGRQLMREIDILLAEDNLDHVFLIKKAFSEIHDNEFNITWTQLKTVKRS